jgi:hypothetical protein
MRKCFLLVGLALPALAAADTVKLPITADVGICAHPKEIRLNTGGNTRIRIKGNEHYYLFDFDTTPIRHWRITKATLHVKLVRGHLRRMSLCTVPYPWVEGSAVNKPQNGSTCYTHRKYPDTPWTPGGGTMLDATFNSPRMLWTAADVTTGKDGWLQIPVDPKLIQAVAVGLSHGLVLADEKGQTRENHDLATRHQSNAKPYLTVEGQPHHVAATFALQRAAPTATPFPQAASLTSGAIQVNIGDPFPKATVDTLGHRIRLLDASRKTVREVVAFRSMKILFEGLPPSAQYTAICETFVGPQGYASKPVPVKASAALPAPAPPKLPAAQQTMPDGDAVNGWWWQRLGAGHKFDAVSAGPKPGSAVGAWPAVPAPLAPRNAWASTQIVLMPLDGKAKDVSVELSELRDANPRPSRVFAPLKHVKLSRVWYVSKGEKQHAEVLVPIEPGRKFDIPWQQNRVPGQANQVIFVDVWVPGNAGPVPYEGALTVKQAGKTVFTVPIRLKVANVTLPDTFHFAGDMNTYSSPAKAMGVKSSDAAAFMDMERKYYRLAHAHRMTLSVLPYSQSGGIDWRGAPKITPKGVDWSEWDERYGPLLSGEAFSEKAGYVGPGAGVPLRHLYLPFHENWPAPLAKNFTPWPPPRDYQKMLEWTAALPPIEKCFDKDYATAWVDAQRQFLDHLSDNKWTRTRYQVYLNNKYYFRRDNGRGISLWLLDEPMYADDFLALRHFGLLTLRGELRKTGPATPDRALIRVKPIRGAPPSTAMIDYRIDISRPTHQRRWLDGVVDLNVCSDKLYSQRRLIAHRKRTFGERYWNYRMPPSFEASNISWATWPIRSYCWGAVGTVPWQTIASDGDLYKADTTALMYPGRKFGLDEPVPSLRMKAWREGLQITELLRMLRTKHKWTDVQLRAFVGQVCGLAGWKDGMDPKEDAPIVTFHGLNTRKLDLLRRATLHALCE